MTTCGFIGMSVRVPRSSISSFQLFIRFCAFSRKLWSDFVSMSGSSAFSTVRQSPTRPISAGWRRPMRVGIDVDLHRLCVARFGIKLHVWEAGTGDDQRVALLQRILRGRRTEQADAPGRVGTPVGDDSLSEQWLYDRSRHCFGKIQHFFASVQAAAAREDGDLRTFIYNFSGRLQRSMRGHRVSRGV